MQSPAPISGKSGHEGDPEAALQVRLRAAKDDHADVHHEEGEERADVDELRQLGEGEEGREPGREDAEGDA